MTRDSIQELLDGTYRDPDGGSHLDAKIRSIVIRDDLTGQESALVQDLGFGDKLVVVSDVTTYRAMGERVESALAADYTVQSVVLGQSPHADDATASHIQDAMSEATSAVIAVGSGTINDLCKAVSARCGLPYAVFATAPSMNGYASATASIAIGGLKRSIPARTPEGVFVDVKVLAAAPPRMIRAGLAECLCRSTAQSDWLLAHLLRDQPYRAAPFDLVRSDEDALYHGAGGLVAGDLESMTRLARALVLSGIGMTVCGSSRSSSQGEHMISHYIDMTRPEGEVAPYHGEQIAVTTLFMAELQERILARDEPPMLGATQIAEPELLAHYGPHLGELCWRELSGKRLDADRAARLNFRLREKWGEIRQRIAAVARPAKDLRAALESAGAPTKPDVLGWSWERYREACTHAREIRNRYTFLDLAADSEIQLFTK